MDQLENKRLIDKRTLLELVPLSYSTIWKLMRRGEFPLSVVVSGRVCWFAQEVEMHLANLPRSRYLPLEDAGDRPRGGGR